MKWTNEDLPMAEPSQLPVGRGLKIISLWLTATGKREANSNCLREGVN